MKYFLPQRFYQVNKLLLYTRIRVYNSIVYNIVTVLVFGFLITFLFVPKAFAQSTPPSTTNDYVNINADKNVEKDIHTLSQVVIIEVLRGASCFLTGRDPLAVEGKCIGVNSLTGKYGYVKGENNGLIGVAGNLISSTISVPVSSMEYVGYLGSNFGIAKTANAQSVGFQGLSPVLRLWETFRNAVYLLFVLIFVVIGLGIMFRVKIEPRTVMTIQNQIPRIIVALILVTLSYAIVGFLIDIMFAFTYLMFNLMGRNTPTVQTNIFFFVNDTLSGGPAGGGILGLLINSSTSIGKIMHEASSGLFDSTLGFWFKLLFLPITIAGDVCGKLIGWIPRVGDACDAASDLPQLIIGAVAGLIAFIVIAIAVLWALFTTWFMLLRAYIFLLLDVIFAPFWISVGILPGASGLGFGKWLRHVLANLAVFPTVIGMFIIGDEIINSVSSTQNGFIPPLIGNPSETGAFGSLIGLGIILSTPQAMSMAKKAFQSPEIQLTALRAATTVGTGTLPGVAKQYHGFKQWNYYNRLFKGGGGQAPAPEK